MATTVTLASKDNFGQIEPNRCTFLHDGNIESQCKATADIENGAICKINKGAKNPDGLGTVSPVTTFTDITAYSLIGVNYTAERIYNQFTPGLKNFKVKAGEYPRIGYIRTGDIFTTNVMLTEATTLTLANDDLNSTAVYWTTPSTLSTTEITKGLNLRVVEFTTMPDGQDAVKIQVLGIK